MKKGTVVFDFDGVIHEYLTPWSGADKVSDGVVPGAIEAIIEYMNAGYAIAICSSRSSSTAGVSAMRTAVYEWLLEHYGPDDGPTHTAQTHHKAQAVYQQIAFPSDKPPAVISIDDRGFRFEGTFPSVDYIASSKQWNKNGASPLLRDDTPAEDTGSPVVKTTRASGRTSRRG